MKSLLHITADERFIERGIALFEAALPGQNEFWVWQRKNTSNLEFINCLRPDLDRVIEFNSPWWNLNFIDWSKYRSVVFHNLYSHPQIYIANNLPMDIPAYWLFFGAEYYNDPNFYPQNPIGPLTATLPRTITRGNRHKSLRKRIAHYLRSRYSRSHRANNPRFIDKRSAFERINCFGTHLPNEMDIVTHTLGINPNWLNFSYYTIEDFQTDSCEIIKKKNQILLGNSATPSNNHLEALSLLKEMRYTGKILCPVSYGDEAYRKAVVEAARIDFPDTFDPIENYLPLQKYNMQIAESSALIMNHHRQQGLGNIITALWYGTRVFVSNHSPALHFFRRLGCDINSTEDDLKHNGQLTPLTDSERSTNRKVLSSAYASKTFTNAIREMDKRLCP